LASRRHLASSELLPRRATPRLRAHAPPPAARRAAG
jgi:hypothetical protein